MAANQKKIENVIKSVPSLYYDFEISDMALKKVILPMQNINACHWILWTEFEVAAISRRCQLFLKLSEILL